MVSVRHYLLPLFAVLFMQMLQPLHEIVAHSAGHEKAYVDCEFCLHVQDVKAATIDSHGGSPQVVIALFLPSPIFDSLCFSSLFVPSARGPPVV